jgi:phosphopantetheinyl transferase
MPLHRTWAPTSHTTAAVWRIEEPEAFFKLHTGLAPDIKHGQKRIEHLAGRFLLQHLVPGIPLDQIYADEHDKPRVHGNPVRFSLSHSYPFVAAIVCEKQECGIDLQTPHPRIEALSSKFLNASEKLLFSGGAEKLLWAWSAKEAAYKWQGRRGVEFSEHLVVQDLFEVKPALEAHFELRLSQPFNYLVVQGWLEEHFALAWACQ